MEQFEAFMTALEDKGHLKTVKETLRNAKLSPYNVTSKKVIIQQVIATAIKEDNELSHIYGLAAHEFMLNALQDRLAEDSYEKQFKKRFLELLIDKI